MKKREKVLWALAGLLLLVSVLSLTVVPGIRFSGLLALALAGVCVLAVFLGRWAEKSRAGKRCQRIFLAGLSAALLLFLLVEGLLLSHGERDHSALPADAVIVLGAGVNGETPSLMLQSRINAAAEYLNAHPDIPAVLSGGQGNGENITEAECMRRWLMNHEVDSGRIICEDKATSTMENLIFSFDIIRSLGDEPDGNVALLSSSYHLYRAKCMAERLGVSVAGVAGNPGYPVYMLNCFIREAFGVTHLWVFGN